MDRGHATSPTETPPEKVTGTTVAEKFGCY